MTAIASGHWRTAAAALPSGRQVIVALACVAVVVVMLWIPVLGDRLTAYLSRVGPKAAPRMFLLGLGALLAGLAFRFGALELVGGCLIGLVLLAVILDNY